MNVYDMIRNSQKIEQVKCSSTEENVVYLYIRILLSCKDEWSCDACLTRDAPCKQYAT